MQALEQQAQDLEQTMQQLVEKGQELKQQQEAAARLISPQPSGAAQPDVEHRFDSHAADAFAAAAHLGVSQREYAKLQTQADWKARMVRYLSDQVQERSEDVREAQQYMADDQNDLAVNSVKERAAR